MKRKRMRKTAESLKCGSECTILIKFDVRNAENLILKLDFVGGFCLGEGEERKR